MKLSLSQAAECLGKTRRQIRYMIQQGHLDARKEGGRWVVDSEHLPLSDAQQQSRARQANRQPFSVIVSAGPASRLRAS